MKKYYVLLLIFEWLNFVILSPKYLYGKTKLQHEVRQGKITTYRLRRHWEKFVNRPTPISNYFFLPKIAVNLDFSRGFTFLEDELLCFTTKKSTLSVDKLIRFTLNNNKKFGFIAPYRNTSKSSLNNCQKNVPLCLKNSKRFSPL